MAIDNYFKVVGFCVGETKDCFPFDSRDANSVHHAHARAIRIRDYAIEQFSRFSPEVLTPEGKTVEEQARTPRKPKIVVYRRLPAFSSYPEIGDIFEWAVN